jgi:hypothetical protein
MQGFLNIVDGLNVFVMAILLGCYRVGQEHTYGFWGWCALSFFDWDSGHSSTKIFLNEHRGIRQRWTRLLLYLSNI